MAERRGAQATGLSLSDAISLLRDELMTARAAGAESDIQLPVQSMTVELTITATKSLDGKAAFTVPVIGEVGGGGSRERGSEQKITVVFSEPVDRSGKPVKVASESDLLPG